MAEKLIQDSTLQAIANAIKTKTGTSDPIPVLEMASRIESITTGGGGDYTVTFMNYDGTVKLWEQKVMEHNTCADPAELDLIPTPTKDSTAQFTYSFEGWYSTANHGGPTGDEDILKNITSDITVYAVMVATVRKYTINFYDGDTLLKSIPYNYGETPSYTPEKTGYMFTGWEPAIVPVTGNADYYAQFVADAIATGTCGDNANWALGKDGTLTISGTGDMYDTYGWDLDPPWKEYASDITTLIVEEGITLFGSYACWGLTNLTSASLPESCTSFGANGRNFYECSKLVTVNVPNNLKIIPTHAFRGTALTTITIPANVTTILGECFRDNTTLTTAIFEDTTTWKCWGWNSNYSAKDKLMATLSTQLEDATAAATYLISTYISCDWKKS